MLKMKNQYQERAAVIKSTEEIEEKDKSYVARLDGDKELEEVKRASHYAVYEKQTQDKLETQKMLDQATITLERLRAIINVLESSWGEKQLTDLTDERQCQLEERRYTLEQTQSKKIDYSEYVSYSSSEFSVGSILTIPYQQIQIIRDLDEGAFGIVSYGKWGFEDVAIKILRVQQLSENTLTEFKAEAAIMTKLRSDYIVLLKGVCLKPYALVMEYMPNGSLFNLLHSQKELPMVIRHRIALDVAKGLAFLHQYPPSGILHRDLKSQNVLLNQYLHAKLADFGLAKVRVESLRSQAYAESSGKNVGTIPWMAPECFGPCPNYSERSDMYAYGMVLWEIISRKIPYENVFDPVEIRTFVKEGERENIPEQSSNPREEIPNSFRNIILFCWFQEIEKRPTAKSAIEMLLDISIPVPTL
jgi:serine/threonine protein kinase